MRQYYRTVARVKRRAYIIMQRMCFALLRKNAILKGLQVLCTFKIFKILLEIQRAET